MFVPKRRFYSSEDETMANVYKCKDCESRFEEREVRERETLYECESCDKRFAKSESFLEQVGTCGECGKKAKRLRAWACPRCGDGELFKLRPEPHVVMDSYVIIPGAKSLGDVLGLSAGMMVVGIYALIPLTVLILLLGEIDRSRIEILAAGGAWISFAVGWMLGLRSAAENLHETLALVSDRTWQRIKNAESVREVRVRISADEEF